MSTTFKIILDKRRTTSKGTYPIRIRIFQGKDYRNFTPSIDIVESNWNESESTISSTHPDSLELNAKLYEAVNKLKRILKICELKEEPEPSLDDLILELQGKKKQASADAKHSIISYGYELAARLEKAERIGNSIVYKTVINRLKKYVGTDRFSFTDLTLEILEQWNAELLSEGLSVNAIANYFRTIRTIYNKGIAAGLAKKEDYPFTNFKIKDQQTASRSLTLEELQCIIHCGLTEKYLEPYRNLFLLSYCLIGANFIDILTLRRDDITNGRIVFRRHKTHKLYSIKLHPQAYKLIDDLNRSGQGYYLLPFLEKGLGPRRMKERIGQIEHNVNDGLKKIAKFAKVGKSISTYYARYSWANIAKRNCGYSKDMISEALGHNYGNKVTGIYLDDYEDEVIDAMNATVIDVAFNRKE